MDRKRRNADAGEETDGGREERAAGKDLKMAQITKRDIFQVLTSKIFQKTRVPENKDESLKVEKTLITTNEKRRRFSRGRAEDNEFDR